MSLRQGCRWWWSSTTWSCQICWVLQGVSRRSRFHWSLCRKSWCQRLPNQERPTIPCRSCRTCATSRLTLWWTRPILRNIVPSLTGHRHPPIFLCVWGRPRWSQYSWGQFRPSRYWIRTWTMWGIVSSRWHPSETEEYHWTLWCLTDRIMSPKWSSYIPCVRPIARSTTWSTRTCSRSPRLSRIRNSVGCGLPRIFASDSHQGCWRRRFQGKCP